MTQGESTAAQTTALSQTGLRGAVDVWVNLFTPEATRRVYFETEEMAGLVEWWHIEDIAQGMSVEKFLGVLDSNNVAKAIIPSTKMWSYQKKTEMYSIEVDEVAAVCEAAPGRLYGAFGINPYERMAGVRKLEESVRDRGFIAALVHAFGYGLPLNARDWFPFYAKCAELEIPVMMQVGHSAEFMPNAVAKPILVDDIALYFPELTIVGCHMGWPWVEECIALAWKHPNVYIATTAHAPKYWDPKFIRFADSRGRDKVVFGTDWPVLAHDRVAREILELGLRDESLNKLLRENALRIFPRIDG